MKSTKAISIGESLAKGRLATVTGLTYYIYLPFRKDGLPTKALSGMEEEIFKNAAHANATKVFVNWLLSRGRTRGHVESARAGNTGA